MPIKKAAKKPLGFKPSKQTLTAGNKGGQQKGMETDYVEVNFEISASCDYQKATAKVGFRTSDPDLIPARGSSKEAIKKKLSDALMLCVDTVDETAFDQIFDALDAMRDQVRKRNS